MLTPHPDLPIKRCFEFGKSMEGSCGSLYASNFERLGDRSFNNPSSSWVRLNTSIQPHVPPSNVYYEVTGCEPETCHYDPNWNGLGEMPSGWWEDGTLHGSSRTNADALYPLQKVEFPETAAQLPPQAPPTSPAPSEFYLQPKREISQQDAQIFQLAEPDFEQPNERAINCTVPDSYQRPSPAFSAYSVSVKSDPLRMTPETPRSSQGTASNFSSSPHDDSDEEGKGSSEPYAKLIYRALMMAPNHCMVLKDIYKWFERHTTKTKNTDSKGWQNSIRHNLSMNGGFRKVQRPMSKDKTNSKGWVWVLEPWAVTRGIESTTRYRRQPSSKKTSKLKDQSETKIPRSIGPGMALDQAGIDRANPELAQYSPFIDRGLDYHFAGDPIKFEMDQDCGTGRQLAELSPYYSLPGSPIDLASARASDPYRAELYQSYDTAHHEEIASQ